jgi:Opacity-associated protein A N-terminal motif
MFGPLPLLHRIVLGAISLCFGVVAGVWIAHATPLPVAISGGALAGGLVGLVAAYVLVHSTNPAPRPVRVTRRR